MDDLAIPNLSLACSDLDREIEPSAWYGHIPFAFWIVTLLKPKIVVELGTHNGISYSALCESIKKNNLDTKAYAVDTWKGDPHAGYYGEEVYSRFKDYHDEQYSQFSTLLRMTFDEAVHQFSDQSIDLLHIDGFHTDEAVKHDFETWLPKLSERAVVLFHDTCVYENNFGVYKLWEELLAQYPGVNFTHSHGLGVLLVGRERHPFLKELANLENFQASGFNRLFQKLGDNYELTYSLRKHQLDFAEQKKLIEENQELIQNQAAIIDGKKVLLAEKEHQLAGREKQLVEQEKLIEQKNLLITKKDRQLTENSQLIFNIQNKKLLRTGIKALIALADLKINFKAQVIALHIGRSNLFDQEWYLERYPDVKHAGVNPILHYINAGASEGRDPSPLFNTNWYLNKNPDVSAAEMNPLYHYIQFGWREGRVPNEASGALNLYTKKNCLRTTIKNLGYKVKEKIDMYCYGSASTVNILECLSSSGDITRPIKAKISVIIPVYLGYEETKKCIEAVIRNRENILNEIIVINDCSPDKNIHQYLNFLAVKKKIKLIKNTKNKGFVASTNAGIKAANNDDVILLNSDTEVPKNWVSRLAYHAYLLRNIGTVTPFSNNATICSWLSIEGTELPRELSLSNVDEAFYNANKGKQISIPTAVGFCMYIRRDCLNEVGLLDEDLFGKGYGEENDFCMRSIQLGWKHVLACDTFVFHEGSISFGNDSPKKQEALKVLTNKYPDYSKIVAKHIKENKAIGVRIAATAAVIKKLNKPKILIITHSWGGGTQRHVNEVIKKGAEDNVYLVLSNKNNKLQIEIHIWGLTIAVKLEYSDKDQLVKFLQLFEINQIQIHHWVGLNLDLKYIVNRLNVPFDFTVHDYYSICPQIHLTQNKHRVYCGEPIEHECNKCIEKNTVHCDTSIQNWRENHSWIIERAKNIICPSRDVLGRLKRYYPQANYRVIPHEKFYKNNDFLYEEHHLEKKILRVGLIGGISPLKGRDILASVAEKVNCCDYKFIVIGHCYPSLSKSVKTVEETGKYDENELQDLIKKANLDVAWFPAVWPETYSYTLSAAIEANLPIVATNLGAFIERLENRPYSWLVELSNDPAIWIKCFEEVKLQLGIVKSKKNSY